MADYELRIYLWRHIGIVLLDILLLPFAACVFLTVWRADLLFQALNDRSPQVTWQSRRLSVLKQFGRLIIDAVGVPVLLAPLLRTLYKLPGLCTRMVAMSKKAKRGDPAFRCEACNVSIPERGKISLALTLSRRQGATADGPVGHLQNLGLRVLGSTSFWASAAEASSDLIVAAAKAMMPVQCKPNDFDVGALAQETEDTVSFHVALPFVTKRTSLEKKFNARAEIYKMK